MRRLTVAWAIVWRMVVYGVGLGAVGGAICGPISMLILYTAELLNERYTLSTFPFANAVTYCFVAIIGGATSGILLGFFARIVSGITLAVGLLLSAGNLFTPKLYRNLVVVLGATGSSAMILIPFSLSVLGDRWFFNGQGVIAPLIALAMLPATISAVAALWAGMRVVNWWETAGKGYNEPSKAGLSR